MLINKTVKIILSSVCIASAFTVSSLAADYYSGTVTANGALNLRAEPATASGILSKLPTGTEVTVLETNAGWHKIICSGKEGYVSAQYVALAENVGVPGYVTGSVVNLRSGASVESDVLNKVTEGTEVLVTGKDGEWYKVIYQEQSGYLFGEYLSLTSDAAASSSASDLIAYAKKYLGVKYRSGGSSPSGFDCSGFTKYVFSNFGINLNRTSADQVKNCTVISKSELRPGDLVFFANPRSSKTKVGHVGIYIGDGQFIHSSSPGDVVKIDSMSSTYYSKYYICSGRVL